MTQHYQNRRRRLVVNGPVQARLILSTTMLPAVTLGLVAVMTAIWCKNITDQATAAGIELPDLMPFFWALVAFEIGAAIFLVGASLRASLRVVGPVVNICRSLGRIRTGDLDFAVKLREGDFLGEIETEINLLLDWLNQNPPPGSRTRSKATAAAPAATTTATTPTTTPTGATTMPTTTATCATTMATADSATRG
jgi:hypothetical protein